ncbi:MAG TPA: flagellar assembly protein FliW [Holophagaceae bacterium]|nr:flagellar assembly protein FliW [Holophagaceae bacterium]
MSDEGILLSFPKGLLGFPELTSFRLFEPSDGYPLKFLQAEARPEISFVCMDPAGIKPDYNVPLNEEEAALLSLEQEADAIILNLVVIPEDPRKMTMNLAGPLVVNVKSKVGLQVVLNAEQFPLQFPVLSQPGQPG